MFQQLSGGLVAGDDRCRRHFRLAKLHVIERLQVEGQSALRSVQRFLAAHSDVLEIGKLAAGQRGFEGSIRVEIHSPEVVVRKTFGICAALVGIACVIAVVDVPCSPNKGVLNRLPDAEIEGLR